MARTSTWHRRLPSRDPAAKVLSLGSRCGDHHFGWVLTQLPICQNALALYHPQDVLWSPPWRHPALSVPLPEPYVFQTKSADAELLHKAIPREHRSLTKADIPALWKCQRGDRVSVTGPGARVAQARTEVCHEVVTMPRGLPRPGLPERLTLCCTCLLVTSTSAYEQYLSW